MTRAPGADRPARILVVEDHPAIQIILTKILTGAGYEATATSDGENALRLLDGSEFDLIVLDVMMPKLDGFGVLGSMRQLGTLRTTAVVMLTALGSDRDWVKGLHKGAHDYLPKPFHAEELLGLVETLLAMGPAERSRHREACLDRSLVLMQLEDALARGFRGIDAA